MIGAKRQESKGCCLSSVAFTQASLGLSVDDICSSSSSSSSNSKLQLQIQIQSVLLRLLSYFLL